MGYLPDSSVLVLASDQATTVTSSSDRTWTFPAITPSPGNVIKLSLQSFRLMHVFKNFPAEQTVQLGTSSTQLITATVPVGNYTPTNLSQYLSQWVLPPLGVNMTYHGENLTYHFEPPLYIGPNTTMMRQLGVTHSGLYSDSTIPVDLENLTGIHVYIETDTLSGLIAFAPFSAQYGFRYSYENVTDQGFSYLTGATSKIRIRLTDQNDEDLAAKYVVNPYDNDARLNFIPQWHVVLVFEEVPAKQVNPSC